MGMNAYKDVESCKCSHSFTSPLSSSEEVKVSSINYLFRHKETFLQFVTLEAEAM